MPTPNAMILPQTVRSPAYTARATAGNVTYSGNSTSGLSLLYAAAAAPGSGSIMTRLRARPIYGGSNNSAFTATQAQLFKVDPNGNVIFDDDCLVPAQTLSSAAATIPGDFGYSENVKRYLPAGWSWYVGIGVAWAPGVSFSGDILDF